MQTSICGLGGTPFRIVFWIGVFVGILLQLWIPAIGELIATLFRSIILMLAGIVQ